jgi:dienelactone hydrolase
MEILLFHHAQGLTAGCLAFADRLGAAGHDVHAPDLYDGKTFGELDDGIAYAEEVGFGTIIERGGADSSLPAYDERAAKLVEERVLAFLGDQ